MNINRTNSMNDPLKGNISTFDAYWGKYPSQSSGTLAKIYHQKANNEQDIQKGIKKAAKSVPSRQSDWELDYMIDYILNNHHYFIWVNLPVVKEYSLKVSRMQGSKYPVVVEVNQLFKELASDLESQLSDQEHQLFPYIKQLVYASRDGKSVSSPRINLSTWSTEVDHQQMAVKLNLILKLLSNLDIANESETTPAVLLYKLRAFQNDLYQHIYLEHDILLPRAMELESKTLIA